MKLSVAGLRAMKREGRKIVGVVAWDTPTARLLDRAGVDLVSVGDSVGVNLWGRDREGDVTLDELALLCAAVRRGVDRALVSCDLPAELAGVDAARRLVEAGADVVKVEGEELVGELHDAGIDAFAQLDGGRGERVVDDALRLEQRGAALLDFRHSGPELGGRATAAVAIPVIGGLGGGPWLDGRMRMIHRAIGYGASPEGGYANVADTVLAAITAYADDVRAGRPVKGD